MINAKTVTSALATLALSAIVSSGPGHASASGVNIIYPPKLEVTREEPAEIPAVAAHQHPVVVKVIIPARHFRRYNYRRKLIHRALGHRYLGFTKVYSGPRYPF